VRGQIAVKVRWGFGVAVLALALACGRAYGQTPTPDPAPVPAPAPALPPPQPVEPIVQEPQERPPAHKTEKKDAPKRRPAVRTARLHPPFVESAPYLNAPSTRTPALASSVQSPFARQGFSDSSPVLAAVLLLVGVGMVTAVIVVFGRVSERVLRGFPELIVDHRGHLAFGSFAVLLGVAIGILIPALLR
jgi:hypothetical protein